jgi:hypothetical protein
LHSSVECASIAIASNLWQQGETVSDKREMDTDSKSVVMNSALYREFLAEREEILRHKWIESEKAGHDIGFERALLDWIVKHRSSWRKARRESRS